MRACLASKAERAQGQFGWQLVWDSLSAPSWSAVVGAQGKVLFPPLGK